MLSIRNNHHCINSKYFRAIAKNTFVYSSNRTGLSSGIQQRLGHTLCRNRKQQQKEFSAALNLLNRSSPTLFHLSTQFPSFHTNTMLYKDKDESSKKSNDSSYQKQNENDEKSKNEKKNGNEKEKKNENDNKDITEKVVSLFTRSVLWFGLGYALYLATMAFRALFLPNRVEEDERSLFVSWQEFVYDMLSAGEVINLTVRPEMSLVTINLHSGAIIKGRRAHSQHYHILLADWSKFEERLREVEKKLGIIESVPITYDRSDGTLAKMIASIIVAIVIISILSKVKFGSSLGMDSFNKMTRAKFTLINPLEGGKGVFFKDVAGLKEAKQEVVEFVDYLKNPKKYQALGAKVPKGALLLGPPGCGKTMLAKAVATESKVPFLSMNGSEFIEMIGGLGAARVRDLFKQASKKAPCIIYIDEIDAIGRQRSGSSSAQYTSGEEEQTLNQLLVEMDGMASKQGVLMLASTNREDILDKALLRPGRFDRHILIDLPTLQERQEIFEHHLQSIVLEFEPSRYSTRLAVLTPGFSGADIANVCNEAALHAARSSKKNVAVDDLEYAVERVVGGTEKRSHALSKEERRVIAFHESGHALVGWLLESSDVLQKVTIVPRTNLALGFAQYAPHDQKLFTKEQILDKMSMALGGRAAENITFSKITTGAQNDLEKVTKMAFSMIRKYGMAKNLGPMYVPDNKRSYSKALGNLIDSEARQIVYETYKKTEQLLKENTDKLSKLAEALLERETLNYDDVVALIGEPKYSAAKRKIDPAEFEDSIKRLSTDSTESM